MISEALKEINDSLREVGADFTVGAEVDVPLRVEVENKTIDTHITVEVTEDGYKIISPDEQVERIVGEIKAAAESSSES